MDHTSKDLEKLESASQDQIDAAFTVLELLAGQWLARSLQVAADLGIADLLHDGPKSVQELAETTSTHAPTLYRLLRTLASRGVFVEVKPEYFGHSRLSETLRSDQPGSFSAIARLYGSEWQWKAWRDLDYSVRTGKAAVEHVYHQKLWDYLKAHPQDAALFQQAMTSTSQLINKTLVQAYNFDSSGTIVDVGGGQGSLLTTILLTYADVRGVLFDLPQVIEGAGKKIAPALHARIQCIPGNFFEGVPPEGDVYIMKQVLHDWSDEDSIRILQTCRKVMKPQAKLLVMDTVVGADSSTGRSLSELTDLLMLVIHAGRERTAREFATLFEASGFKPSRIISTGSPISIVEGIPAA